MRKRETVTRLAALAAATVLMVLGTQPVLAIPSLTPHSHMNPWLVERDTTRLLWWPPVEQIPDPDPDFPDAWMHQHHDRDNLLAGTGYTAYSVWDNNQYRLGGQFGHGFQAGPALYQF